MTIPVCLCGQPVPPLLQGVPSPRTAQAICRFLDSLRQAQEQPKADDLAAAFRSHAAVERAQLPALRQRVRKLEQAIGRQLAKQRVATGERKARGRHWQLPRPMPTSSQRGTRGREWLVHQLQKQGLTFRKARAAVTAVLKVVREGLRNDGLVQTPMGEFYLRSLTPPYERKRWGRNQTLYLQRTRVVFKLDRIRACSEERESDERNDAKATAGRAGSPGPMSQMRVHAFPGSPVPAMEHALVIASRGRPGTQR